jgi:flagellar basal body rod protein FlgG
MLRAPPDWAGPVIRSDAGTVTRAARKPTREVPWKHPACPPSAKHQAPGVNSGARGLVVPSRQDRPVGKYVAPTGIFFPPCLAAFPGKTQQKLRFCSLAPSLLGSAQSYMDVGLYQAAAAMNASSRWQEIISDNLASNQVPGFKKQDLSFRAVQAGLMARNAGTAGSARHSAMPLATTATNFEAGELNPTGSSTDLALNGPGFFTVQLPDGQSGYTRNGTFQINLLGQLVTKHGWPVLGDTGPLQLDPNNTGPITIAPTGTITQGGTVKGQLKLAAIDDPSVLTATRGGIYISTDPNLQPDAPANVAVLQGYLEGGNTSPMSEMSNLITSMRYFEANQKVIQNEDDRMSRLITDVANPAGSS